VKNLQRTGRLGDRPTIKVHPVRFAEYAKRQDARFADTGDSSAPEIEVHVVEIVDDETLDLHESPGSETRLASRPDNDPIAAAVDLHESSRSETRLASRPDSDPIAAAVPVIAVAKEDLDWFDLDAEAHAILALVDGESTVEEIIASVALARFEVLDVIRQLESQNILAFR
jgi:hypothetical protein